MQLPAPKAVRLAAVSASLREVDAGARQSGQQAEYDDPRPEGWHPTEKGGSDHPHREHRSAPREHGPFGLEAGVGRLGELAWRVALARRGR